MSSVAAEPELRVTTIQVGLGWLPEQAGGLNRMYFELARRLPGQGVAFHGLVAGTPRVFEDSGGRVRAFAAREASMWSRLRSARREVNSLLVEHPDAILVSHFAPYGMALLRAARTRPLIVFFQGPWSQESRAEGRNGLSGAFRKMLEGRVYRAATRCIVLSRAFATLLEREFGVPADRIHVLPGGVDLTPFASLPSRAEARRRLGWDPDARIVLAVRRLVRRTGIDNLIAAVPALKERVPDIQVMIAGTGPERAACEAMIRDKDLGAHARLLGFVPEDLLPLAYRAADLSVVPTISLEGFGLIVPESLAAGTPVLVTPIGGLPETVEDLSPDLILRDSSPAAISDGIAEALDGRRRLPSAEECASFARARYDWDVVTGKVAAIMASVV